MIRTLPFNGRKGASKMARKTIETSLIGARVKVRDGHGINQNKEGVVRGVYLAREDSVFGDVMLLIATDSGEMFDTFASVVTLVI
jgi:hypothetical protein